MGLSVGLPSGHYLLFNFFVKLPAALDMLIQAFKPVPFWIDACAINDTVKKHPRIGDVKVLPNSIFMENLVTDRKKIEKSPFGK